MSGSKSSDASLAARAPEGQQPLGLTVHSLPPAGDAVAALQRSRSGRWQMLAVLAVCAAPVIASYFTYYVVRPEGRRNYGELVEPQRAIPPQASARTLGGAPRALESLRGQWLLVSVAPGACADACRNHLYLQRQLRESMGREKERLDWVWLVSDDAQLPDDIAPALGQATVLRVDSATLGAWLQPAAGQALADHIYVVDPMGHWMMRFPAHMDRAGAAKAKRDLERLLRASSSWDQPGRTDGAGQEQP